MNDFRLCRHLHLLMSIRYIEIELTPIPKLSVNVVCYVATSKNFMLKQRFNASYSETAQRTSKPSYLEPNSQSMQKPIGGLLALLKNVEDRSAIGVFRNQKHAEKSGTPSKNAEFKRRLIPPIEMVMPPAQLPFFIDLTRIRCLIT
jgi:hypothetical protein